MELAKYGITGIRSFTVMVKIVRKGGKNDIKLWIKVKKWSHILCFQTIIYNARMDTISIQFEFKIFFFWSTYKIMQGAVINILFLIRLFTIYFDLEFFFWPIFTRELTRLKKNSCSNWWKICRGDKKRKLNKSLLFKFKLKCTNTW